MQIQKGNKSFQTFTFHNVSINSNKANFVAQMINLFTFHNVSINSRTGSKELCRRSKFTFHNVSINSCTTFYRDKNKKINLHSTMFLLILFTTNHFANICTNLHSTMFLLILTMH